MVPPRAPSFSGRGNRDLVGRIRTCALRRPKSVGLARLPYDQSMPTSSPAGLEPATRGVEALCSSAELRGDRRPWNRTTLHRRIRAAPAQSACRRRCRLQVRRQKPTPPGMRPAAGGDPSGATPLGGIALANKQQPRREESRRRCLLQLRRRKPTPSGMCPAARRGSERRDSARRNRAREQATASPGGFEPPSPTVAGWCSVPLSYGES